MDELEIRRAIHARYKAKCREVRALIAEFNDGDHVKSVHMIVKERRGAFLDRLAALK